MQDKHTEPHWDSSALIIIDMQNAFVSPKIEKEGTKAEKIISNIRLLLDAYRNKRLSIVHVVRSYAADGSDADTYRRGMVERGELVLNPGTDEADIVSLLKPPNSPAVEFRILKAGMFHGLGDNEMVMYKPRLGAFYNTPLEGWLKYRGADTCVFAGTFFSNCVRASITEATERDFRCVAARDAIFGIYERAEKEIEAIGVACLDSSGIIASIGK